MLDSISELYGRNRARQTILLNCTVLLFLSGVIYLSINHLPTSLPKEQADMYAFTLNTVPRALVSLAMGLLIADWLNVNLFHALRKKTSGRALWLRALVSTTLSQSLFLCIGAVFIWGSALLDPETFRFFYVTSGWQVLLFAFYIPITYVVVHGVKKYDQWNRQTDISEINKNR